MNFRSLLDEFVTVLQDPAAEPVRTALVAALLFVAFVAVALLALIVLPPRRSQDEGDLLDETLDGNEEAAWGGRTPEQETRRGRYLAWGYRFLVGGILLAALGGALFADGFVRSTSFCLSRCHVLDVPVSSWQAGVHPKVDCVDCHRTPGAFGPVDTRVRAVRDTWANLQGAETLVAAAVVDQQACRRCHAQELRGVLEKGGLRVRHRDFETVLSCGICHPGVGHQLSGVAVPGPESTMSLCARCHVGGVAPSDCRTCHTDDLLRVGGEDAALGKIDLPAPKDCRGCHDLRPCTECHGIEMPHPPEWGDPKTHARKGAFGLDPVCARCHEEGCPQCHSRLHTNHGPDWQTKHQAISDGTGCVLRCHDKTKVGDDMCRLCH